MLTGSIFRMAWRSPGLVKIRQLYHVLSDEKHFQAVLHQLATHTLPLAFFATHYGSLTDDFAYHPNIRRMHMATLVDEDKRDVSFPSLILYPVLKLFLSSLPFYSNLLKELPSLRSGHMWPTWPGCRWTSSSELMWCRKILPSNSSRGWRTRRRNRLLHDYRWSRWRTLHTCMGSRRAF